MPEPLQLESKNRGGRPAKPLIERFWSMVEKGESCWLWIGPKDKDGYGVVSIGSRSKTSARAHRVAYQLLVGDFDKSLQVLHTCDNSSCVNPAHLFLGTNQDNVDDKVRKGRQARGQRHGAHTKPESRRNGEKHGCARLTEADVRAIRAERADGVPLKVLAAKYGVAQTNISMIAQRKTWRHI